MPNPNGVGIDNSGNLMVGEFFLGNFLVHTNGVLTPLKGQFRGADAVEQDSKGNYYVSSWAEALVFGGRVPRSEFQRMRAPFQAGDFPAPVKYGYASVGIVEQGPPELAGKAIFSLHPHQTRYVVPVSAVHVLPDAVPPARAVLAANMETALNGLWGREKGFARDHAGQRRAVSRRCHHGAEVLPGFRGPYFR
jgi:hypothetical protein